MIGGRRMMMGRGGGQPLTRLLVHFDSAAMPPVDVRGGAYSVTTAGQSLSAVDPKFGARSLLNAGGGGYFAPGPGISFSYGDEDWCLEAWVKVAAHPDDVVGEICAVADGAAPQIGLMSYNYQASGVNPGGSLFYGGYFELFSPVWQHLAVYRIGDDVCAALDGIVVAHLGGAAWFGAGDANRLYIGQALYIYGYNSLQGNIDELRYSVGTSRYGASNFTPPAGPFTLD